MTTMSIDEMKQRILKPNKRGALNANKTQNQTDSQIQTPSQAPMGGSRGEAHPSVESGSLANQTSPPFRFPAAAAVSPFQGVYGGTTPLRIPKPSELFGVSAGFPRPSQPTGTAPHPTLQRLPESSGVSTVPQLPTPGLLSAASVTRQREHDRRLRAISTKMQRANLKRRMEASQGLAPTPTTTTAFPMGLVHSLPQEDTLPANVFTSPLAGGAWPGILSGLKKWITRDASLDSGLLPTPRAPEHDVGVHIEFDTDVVDALVYTVGRWMGLDTEQLRDSPGLRTLVSRNIQWFRASPDWMKLLGLVLAKKLNHSLDTPRRSPSDTQRMLMERLLNASPEAVATAGGQSAAVDIVETAPSAEVSILPPKPKKYTKKSKQSATAAPAKKKGNKKSIPINGTTKRPRDDVPKTSNKKPKKNPPSPSKKTPLPSGTKKTSKAPKKTERRINKKRGRPISDLLAEPSSAESPTVSLDMAPVVLSNPIPMVPESDEAPPTDHNGPDSALYSIPNTQPSLRDWESE